VALNERGRVVGTLLSGLSARLLLARTLSGLVGAHAGWRSMFVLAGFIDVVLMAIVWTGLPEIKCNSQLRFSRTRLFSRIHSQRFIFSKGFRIPKDSLVSVFQK
jgi:predicted MFS family arabinose efflux permease